jgi:hypothetical protein
MKYYLIITEKLAPVDAFLKDVQAVMLEFDSEQECRDAKEGTINLLFYGKEVESKIRINRHEENQSCEEFYI